jgi:hypothetical protein
VSKRMSFLPVPSLPMVAFATLIFATLVATKSACAGDNSNYSYARIVRLSYVNGDVQIVRTDKSNKWEPAVMNMPVEQGFAVGTNNGRAEIELEHGSTIWLAENSVLQFTELALSNGGRMTRMSLSQGTATFDASLSAGDAFEVAAPSFRVMLTNKSEFRIDMQGKSGAVSVFNGKVSVNNAAGTQDVAKGQTLAVSAKSSQASLKSNPSKDEWDHWVNNRLTAQVVGQNKAALYTNAPFTYGMADLAGYGSWNFFPGFGYGWQPWGISAGWAPFMSGEWMFYPSLGWTWLSAEPWGWVPYHFGGWQYSSAFGWMWFPGDYGRWAAAPVQWVSVGNRIGWVPANTLHTASTAVPVVVGSKTLGKEGSNRVMSATEVSSKLQVLAAQPAANGKAAAIGAASTTARVVVPTAASLGSLRGSLVANSAARINVNALHAAGAVPAIDREFRPVNAGMLAGRMPGRPPSHAAFGPEGFSGFSAANGGQITSAASSHSAGVPVATSHASSAGGSGKPH